MAHLLLDESSAPSTPATGKVAIYAKTDGLPYSKDDTGTETSLGGAPPSADYLVKTANGSLSAERVVTDGTSITADWSAAGQVTFKRAALTGDVTASADGNATTIANDAVTYAKMQNVSATDKVLGRSTAGAGDVEEITCTAAGRALLDDAAASDQRTTLGLGALAVKTTVATGDVDDAAITYTKIQDISATSRVLGRKTAGAGDTEECSLSEVLDFIGSAAQGDVLYRGAATWARLGAGTSGHFLKTNGAGANPEWAAGSGGSSKPYLHWTALGNQPPASAYATPDVRNSHPVLDFDGGTDEEAVFGGVLPSTYAGGGLTVDTYWALTSATSGSLRVQAAIERIDASSLDIDADSFAAFQSAGGTAPGTSGQVIKVTVTFTDGAQMDSLAASEAFRLKIRRDADGTSGTDDIPTDAELLRVTVRET